MVLWCHLPKLDISISTRDFGRMVAGLDAFPVVVLYFCLGNIKYHKYIRKIGIDFIYHSFSTSRYFFPLSLFFVFFSYPLSFFLIVLLYLFFFHIFFFFSHLLHSFLFIFLFLLFLLHFFLICAFTSSSSFTYFLSFFPHPSSLLPDLPTSSEFKSKNPIWYQFRFYIPGQCEEGRGLRAEGLGKEERGKREQRRSEGGEHIGDEGKVKQGRCGRREREQ